MEEWTGTERQPEKEIKTGRNQRGGKRKKLTSGEMKDRGREK